YKGCAADLSLFGTSPLETDEVASAPEIDLTERGRETALAKWIIRRLKVETTRVVRPSTSAGRSSGGGGDRRSPERAPRRPMALWQRALVTSYEVETRRRETAASRAQGLSRMKQARDRARELVFSQFEKRFDVYSGTFYYHSNKTRQDTFTKPRVLRPDQDLEEPSDQWIVQKDKSGKLFYTNPATGER
ncbi:unnamed protein product, partial [Sphacelaria rigidula]